MAETLGKQRDQIVDDLQRLYLKLRVEAAMNQDAQVAKRLNDLALEAEDTLNRLQSGCHAAPYPWSKA